MIYLLSHAFSRLLHTYARKHHTPCRPFQWTQIYTPCLVCSQTNIPTAVVSDISVFDLWLSNICLLPPLKKVAHASSTSMIGNKMIRENLETGTRALTYFSEIYRTWQLDLSISIRAFVKRKTPKTKKKTNVSDSCLEPEIQIKIQTKNKNP